MQNLQNVASTWVQALMPTSHCLLDTSTGQMSHMHIRVWMSPNYQPLTDPRCLINDTTTLPFTQASISLFLRERAQLFQFQDNSLKLHLLSAPATTLVQFLLKFPNFIFASSLDFSHLFSGRKVIFLKLTHFIFT